MKILKYLFLFFVIAFLAVLVIGIFTSPNLKVEVDRTINAPVNKVYAQVDDFKNWTKWNAWLQMDGETVVKFGNKTKGVGGSYSWMSQNSNIGQGKMTFTRVVPNKEIDCELDFGEMGISKSYWKFEADGNKTKVTNGFTTEMGNSPFTKFFFGVIGKMGMKGNLNSGLENIAKLVE